jgi:hypothetical protein
MQCEFIFPTALPGSSSPGFRDTEGSQSHEVGHIYATTPGPTTWVDWKTSETLSQQTHPISPINQSDLSPQTQRRRFRPRRPPFPWTLVVVGLVIGLALLASIVVLIVALWLKK